MPYKIIPISENFLSRARSGLDDQHFPVEFFQAEGGEPLRDVLRRAEPGEAIALASFSPHTLNSPYKEYGPIYIRATASDESVPLDSLPASTSRDYLRQTFVLRAYSQSERIINSVLTTEHDAEKIIADFFEIPEVAFILARFGAYGCYACRIERVPS